MVALEMSRSESLERVRAYYDVMLERHGPTFRGVDWNSEQSQQLRFAQLASIMDRDANPKTASVLDFGCGYGALAHFLRRRGWRGNYHGIDLSARMLAAATRSAADLDGCRFSERLPAGACADYVLASGVFNVKQETPAGDWKAYMEETLIELRGAARRGVAFNILTAYSDADRQRDSLYYADPSDMLRFCLGRLSRHTALFHDYELYEFTVHVRL
jgi:SAM-dependent methyltransferase